MIRNLDTALIRTFVTVADKASMTAAANALHLTQGAVSQQIKRLEEALGCSLFERDRRGLRLTRPGERLFGKGKRLLGLNDEIWAEMAGTEVAGQVRLGVPYDLVGTLLAPVLKAYAETYPQVEISLLCAASPDLAAALAAGTIDLAVIEERVGPSAGECLAIDRLVWVGAKGGVARAKRPLPVSIVADTCAFRPVVLSALNEHGLEWRTVERQHRRHDRDGALRPCRHRLAGLHRARRPRHPAFRCRAAAAAEFFHQSAFAEVWRGACRAGVRAVYPGWAGTAGCGGLTELGFALPRRSGERCRAKLDGVGVALYSVREDSCALVVPPLRRCFAAPPLPPPEGEERCQACPCHFQFLRRSSSASDGFCVANDPTLTSPPRS
ncbi:hypothetical protein X733_07530 [Mesorhizobium sp. L2C067A000]|nr:hypothetical protein X733_07530 [Mesorhizobium sp. L2C067A000]